jgi:DNA-binding NtrC family response regulator
MEHVLVLDDDLACREAMQGYLERDGFYVTTASDEDILPLLQGVRPRCLVIATTLDGGRERALDLVRSTRESDPNVGIVVVANGDIDLVEKAITGLDVWAVVQKPNDIEKLPSKVKKACEFAAMSIDQKEKLVDDLTTQTIMFRRVKRETSRVKTDRFMRPAASPPPPEALEN